MSGARIAVLGGGAWGTALALTAMRAGNHVSLWARDQAIASEIERGRNAKYLPGMSFETGLKAAADLSATLAGVDIVLAAVPAQALRETLIEMRAHLSHGVPIVLCAKGIEHATGKFLSEIAAETCPDNPTVTLSGPSFAADVARGLPTAVVVAGIKVGLPAAIAARLSTRSFRCYSSTDQTGVETGGALKNVLAIAAGAAFGAGLGASAQAALVTRGFVELGRLGAAFGARSETLTGLSGLGDLMLTCASAQSRNFAYGIASGRGDRLSGRPLAEGVATAGIAARIAQERNIDAPIIAATALMLAGRLTIAQAVDSLMSRLPKSESDET